MESSGNDRYRAEPYPSNPSFGMRCWLCRIFLGVSLGVAPMSKNLNGDPGSFRRGLGDMEWSKFDRLPKKVKEIYWYAPLRLRPINLRMKARAVAGVLNRRKAHMAAATIATYGELHPDAGGVALRR